jgi:hypothetical protein
MSYKKEFIVSKIEPSKDNSPYVYVSIYTKEKFSPTRRQQSFPENPFGVAAIPITSLDDLKNLPKKISDVIESGFRGDRNNMSSELTTFKMNIREFEELGIKIGDKVMLEMNISNDNDIIA